MLNRKQTLERKMEDQQEIQNLIQQIKMELSEKEDTLLETFLHAVSGTRSVDELHECYSQIERILFAIKKQKEALVQLQALSAYLYYSSLNVAHLRDKTL